MRGLLLAALVVLPAGLEAQTAAPARPAWIATLPDQAGRLYALGTAQLAGSESDAINRASDRARLEVVTRLRATVRGRTSVTTRTSETRQAGAASGAGERQVRDEMSVGAEAEDLPGLVVERNLHGPARAHGLCPGLPGPGPGPQRHGGPPGPGPGIPAAGGR